MKKILKIITSTVAIMVLLIILIYVALSLTDHLFRLDFLTFASIKPETISSTGLTVSITNFNINGAPLPWNVGEHGITPQIPDGYPNSSTLDFYICEPRNDNTSIDESIRVYYTSKESNWKSLKTTDAFNKAEQSTVQHITPGNSKFFYKEYNLNFEFMYGKLAPGHYKLVLSPQYKIEFDVK